MRIQNVINQEKGFLSILQRPRKKPQRRLKGFMTFRMQMPSENLANMRPASQCQLSIIMFLEESVIVLSLKSSTSLPSNPFSAILVEKFSTLSYSQFSKAVLMSLNRSVLAMCFFGFSIVSFCCEKPRKLDSQLMQLHYYQMIFGGSLSAIV